MRVGFEGAAIALAFALLLFPLGIEEANVERKIPEYEPETVTLIFAGDMLFDRSIREKMEERGGDYIFSCIDPVLSDADFVIANLEGPITPLRSVSKHSKIGTANNYRFTFPMETAELLFRHNIRVVNLGNNHILNFGTEGVHSTLRALERADVLFFGDPLEYSVALLDLRGVRFAFINYSEFDSQEHANKLENVGMSSTTVVQIREVRADGGIPIVYAHWGDEYTIAPPERVRQLAREFIDAGAEIVIGSHPHVIQDVETYRGKYIFYSLGNFIFDQYWNDSVRTGLLVRAEMGRGGAVNVGTSQIRLEKDRRTCPLDYLKVSP